MSNTNDHKNPKISVTYRFANEVTEISVDVLVRQEGLSIDKAIELCELLKSFDRDEENLERKETRRHISLSLFDDDINAPKTQKSPMSVEEELIRDEMQKVLFDTIEKVLTPKQKQRLFYRIFDGMTFEEIADMEGATHPAIIKSVNNALKKIKKYFSY